MARIPDEKPLIGRIVRLDPTQESDRDDLIDALDDPRVFALGYAGGATDRVAAIENLIAGAGGNRVMYTIRLVGDTRFGPAGKVVGTTSLGDLEPRAQRAHAGWTAYRPALWGTGVNAEVKLLLLGHAFEDCGFERVKLQTDSINQRSQDAIARLGAVQEGVLRHHQPRADGSWRDTVVFSILSAEWPAVRAGLESRVRATLTSLTAQES
mgnify:FL=1